jgi:GrpB-like predicted nucleotidyltransferase (UPF0157 family)
MSPPLARIRAREASYGVESIVLHDVAELQRDAADVVGAFARDWRGRLGDAEIHHIGATALPFGHTKGDVDVNVRVRPERFDDVVRELSAQLAVAQLENWTAAFASFSADNYRLPLGVQVTAIGSGNDFLLRLRDTLIAEPELLERYDGLKLAAAAGGADAYWQAKDRFLRELLLDRR